jgi:DNA-binding LacI/PurR family transcriptional regulator
MPASFQTLPVQVAAVLREEITAGEWPHALPSERKLAGRLRVGRRTIRAALTILRKEGCLATQPRRSSATLKPVVVHRNPARLKVALLLPGPIETMRHLTALWVHFLMTALQAEGSELEVFHGRRFFGSASGRSLQRLVIENPACCWVLGRSSLAMQRWFAAEGVPAVVAGGVHPGVSLPSVDVDHRALGRHVAGVLARRGHRGVVSFLGPTRQIGDAECEAGLRDAGLLECSTVYAGESPEAVVTAFRRILRLRPAPTGFLFANSFAYLTVSSWLASQEWPEPLVLLTRDDEPFLSYLSPPPGRYSLPPEKFAAGVYRAIRQRIAGDVVKTIRLIPEFREG